MPECIRSPSLGNEWELEPATSVSGSLSFPPRFNLDPRHRTIQAPANRSPATPIASRQILDEHPIFIGTPYRVIVPVEHVLGNRPAITQSIAHQPIEPIMTDPMGASNGTGMGASTQARDCPQKLRINVCEG